MTRRSSRVDLTSRARRDQAEDAYVNDFETAVTSRSNANVISARPDMRTFVFSATMSKELQLNLKRKGGARKFIPKAIEGDMTSLDDLLDKLDFRDPDPEIIDLSPEHGLVETLKECKVECMQQEKVRSSRVAADSTRPDAPSCRCRTSTCTTSSSGTRLALSSSSPRSMASVACTLCSRC